MINETGPAPLDAASLDANRHGRLSTSQRRLVRREMANWTISAGGVAAGGLLLAVAIPSPVLMVVILLVAAAPVIYMGLKGYECAQDSVQGRVAAVTDRFESYPIETGSTDGARTLVTLRGRRFWVPTRAREALAGLAMTVYFTPRARVVVNAEPAAPEQIDRGAGQTG